MVVLPPVNVAADRAKWVSAGSPPSPPSSPPSLPSPLWVGSLTDLRQNLGEADGADAATGEIEMAEVPGEGGREGGREGGLVEA